MEARLGRIRRFVPGVVLLCVAALAVALAQASRSPRLWTLAVGLVVTLAVMRRLCFRTVHRDGSGFDHRPGELLIAFAVAVGVAPFVAAAGVSLACFVTDVWGPDGRLVAARRDWQRRTKIAVTAVANVVASVATWAAATGTAALLPTEHAARGLVLGTVAGLTYGVVVALLLAPAIAWVGTGQVAWPRAALQPQLVPAVALSSAGAVLAALVTEVHPATALVALAGAWPLPALLRRRNELEERHQHALRLLSVASDAEESDRHDVAARIASTVAAMLHYEDGHVRDTAPTTPDEIGTRLTDGSWLVLASPLHLALPDPDDQPTLDGLGLLAGRLIDAGRARAARNRELKRDALTGLANRAGLADAVERLPRRSALVVAYLDLNGFKPINDRYGHDAGDVVLAEIGRRLADQLRGSDVAARVGGDEFVLALPGPGDGIAATQVVRRLVASLGAPVDLGCGAEVRVDVAVGVAIGSVEDFSTLVTRADTAMYADKRRRGEATAALAASPRREQGVAVQRP